MAISLPTDVLLRPHSEAEQGLVYPNAKPSDYSRTIEKHNKRKKYHEDKLEQLKGSVLALAEQKKFKQFCNEVEDCYDTNMLLLICAAFEEKIKREQQYFEFLYKKILMWALKEEKLRDYLSKLNDIYEKQIEHNQAIPENDFKGIRTLITMLRRSNFQLVPIDSSNTEAHQSSSTQSETVNHFSTDSEIGYFLTEIHYSSPKVPSHRKQHPLVKQSRDIKTAISQIQLFFTTNEEVKDQKFIGKVINALGQKGDKINITVGFLTRKSYRFNRHELLVLIRSNPILYAEFKKAGGEKKLREGDEKNLFTDNFVSSAKSLLSDKLILSTPINSTDAQILTRLQPGIAVSVESERPDVVSHRVEGANDTIDSRVSNDPIQQTRPIRGITLDFDDDDDLEAKTVISVSTNSTDLDDNMDSVSSFGDNVEEEDDFGEAESIKDDNSTATGLSDVSSVGSTSDSRLTAANLARSQTQYTHQSPNIADVDSLSIATSIRSNKTIPITPTKQQPFGSPRSMHSGLSDVLSINSSPTSKDKILAGIEEDDDSETVIDAPHIH